MYVNPFWFGVLMTVVGLVVVFIIAAFINAKRADAEEGEDVWMDEAASKKMLGEAVRDALRQNIVFGEEIADRDDENH